MAINYVNSTGAWYYYSTLTNTATTDICYTNGTANTTAATTWTTIPTKTITGTNTTGGWTTIPANTGGFTIVIGTGGGGGGGAIGNNPALAPIIPDVEDLAVIVKKKETPKPSGCRCEKCKDFNEYAEPNRPDNKFVCYSCRSHC